RWLPRGFTRSFNRRYFLDGVTAELRFAGRHGTSIGVLLLDIDRFKRVNEVHGYAAGHRVLAALGAPPARELRAEDVVARWGGQEFVVLLRAVPASHVRVAAERVCQTIRDLRIE